MSVRTIFFGTFCLAVSILSSCTDDAPEITHSVVGRWELVKGLRAQKQTGTLAGIYFEFGADGKMKTNMPSGTDAAYDYELKKNVILQKSSPELKYQVISANDTFLVLSTELRSVQFDLYLRLAPPVMDSLQRDSTSILQDTLTK